MTRTLLSCLTALCVLALAGPGSASAARPFQSQGMWIWYVSQAEGGDVSKIVARARKNKVRTVFVKSSDGASWWKQWDQYAPSLKAAGLNVCAWQYVYGKNPVAEANLAARAAQTADCIVTDVETEYKGNYTAAQKYLVQLRAQIGNDYPVGFTSFAYPDYHPTVPFSAFLGPGGAQWNLPQMYFKDFGHRTPRVFKQSLQFNQIYQRPVVPIGQTYQSVNYRQVIEFRRHVRAYRLQGYSWWAWQFTGRKTWPGLRRKLKTPKRVAMPAYPTLVSGNNSDMVRWAKLKLNADGAVLGLHNKFDTAMKNAVVAFQAKNGLAQTGQVDLATWPQLQAVSLPALSAATR